jgi:glycosyltransferase involved in cell wall biosynthesis
MSVDVTVVVPVYNPGHYLEVCLDSLFAQSLSVDRREFIFVDDGSTDDTPARLDDLAGAHDEVRVIHQPNSGWPGKPRNVGIDHATGEFVFFSDHDDKLGPEALERMVAMARRTGADVLIPKMVGNGRPVPHRLFHHSIDAAVLGADPLMESLTPHKLFRRGFLNDIGLRFPEGKRRLEDHVFVTEAYLRASVISVMADYPGYHRIHRDDDGNASVQGLDPDFYFQFVAETVDVIDRLTEPGELRNRLLIRPYGGELVGKLAEKRVHRWDDELRQRIFDTVRPLLLDRFPPEIADRLRIARRAHAHAIQDGDLERLIAIADRAVAPVAAAELRDLVWTGDRWQGSVEIELRHADGSPILLTPVGDRLQLDPRLLGPGVAAADYDRDDVLSGYADVLLRDADDVEWYLPSTVAAELVPVDDDPSGRQRLVFRGGIGLDPVSAVGGRAMAAGDWEFRVRLEAFGIARSTRLRAADGAPIATSPVVYDEAVVVAPTVGTAKRGIGVTVSEAPKSLVRLVSRHVSAATIDPEGRLRGTVELATVGTVLPDEIGVVLLDSSDTSTATLAARLVDGTLLSDPIDPAAVGPHGAVLALVDTERGRAFVVAEARRQDSGAIIVGPAEFRAIRLAGRVSE